MNANRIINMIMRQIMRRVVTRGIGAGLDMAGRSRDADTGRTTGSRGGNDAQRTVRPSETRYTAGAAHNPADAAVHALLI